MSSICLKVTTEKKWHSKYFAFISLSSLYPSQFWRAPTQADTIEFSNFLLQLKSQRSGNKTVAFLLYLFCNKLVLKSKSLCFKNKNFKKMRQSDSW